MIPAVSEAAIKHKGMFRIVFREASHLFCLVYASCSGQ